MWYDALMAKSFDIVEFVPSDGLTPLQVQKLNWNFRKVANLVGQVDVDQGDAVKGLVVKTVDLAADRKMTVSKSGTRNRTVLSFGIPAAQTRITQAQVDSVLENDDPTGDGVLNLTGLSRFWAGVRSAIADISDTFVTGVKGDAESSYRRGNVNLTPANIGASPTGHTHDAADTVSGEFAVARIPNLNANKITAGTLALARGGTASNNTDRAINTVFAGPSSGSAGNASWRKLAAADIPNLNASKITAGTFGIDRIPTITPAKGGTGRTSAQIATYTIFSGKNAGDGATLGTNTDVFNYRIFLVKLNNVGTYLIGYRTGNTSSAGYILAGNNEFQETAGGDKAAGCKISVSTAGLCKVVAAGYHKLQNNVAITTTSSNVTGVWGLY